jgi:hypothetical protein
MKILERIKEGDVIYTNCIGNELCYHLGVVYVAKGMKYIFHNAPTNNNRFGGTVIFEKAEDFVKDREIYRIVSTNAKNSDILRVSNKCRTEVWDTFFFNCEDYVVEIVEGERRSDLRDIWRIGAFGIALISVF